LTHDFQTLDDLFLADVITSLRRAEPVPAGVVAAARKAYSWRSVATAIADLEFDSAVDDDDLVRVRSVASERHLRFRDSWRVAEMSVMDGRRIAGRLYPSFPGSVYLRRPGRPEVVTGLDELGQFLFDGLAPGTISIRAVPDDPDQPAFQTEWVTV
jgi:hypothetical protein